MSENRALRPVETEPGVFVHTRADRQLATEHWLLSAHPAPTRARREWTDHKMALLPLGTLFSAVRIPQSLVLAVVGRAPHAEVDTFLAEALNDGPVICDPRGHRYYALVPGSMPAKWSAAAEEWLGLGVGCLGRGTYLGVPRLDVEELDPEAWMSYWSVPILSAGDLCAPLAVARLLAAGKHCLAGRPDL